MLLFLLQRYRESVGARACPLLGNLRRCAHGEPARVCCRHCWAPPPWTEETAPHPVLTRVGAGDWPANDPTIYDRSAFVCGPVRSDQAWATHAAAVAIPSRGARKKLPVLSMSNWWFSRVALCCDVPTSEEQMGPR